MADSKQDNGGMIKCRCRIVGTYKGERWEYVDPEGSKGSQTIHPPDDPLWPNDPSTYLWTSGNMDCDCNRAKFLGATPETHPDLYWHEGGRYPDGSKINWTMLKCGETIRIDRIEPIDGSLPTLVLNESTNGKGGE